MKITIKGSEKEIAAFVLDLQKQHNESGQTIINNIKDGEELTTGKSTLNEIRIKNKLEPLMNEDADKKFIVQNHWKGVKRMKVNNAMRKLRRKLEKEGKKINYVVEIEEDGKVIKTIKSKKEPSK